MSPAKLRHLLTGAELVPLRPDQIGPADVGHRVVIRRRLPGARGPTGGQAYSDVLGIVEHCDAATVRVRRADGYLVEIAITEVARAKRIPPPPVRRRQP